MAEKDLWAILRDRMKLHGHFERIENMVGRGRPDVNYCITACEGNIELKQIQNWPTREESIVRVEHFTPQQRIWIRQRVSAGGRVFVLLEVVRPVQSYFLLPGRWAWTELGKRATRAHIEHAAVAVGLGSFPTPAVLRELTAGRVSR